MAGYWAIGGISHLSSAWPYGMRDVSAFFSTLILLSNLVATVMGLAILYIAWRLSDPHRNWAWAGLLMAATNGVFVYYCRVGNLDIPYNFWWAVTLFFLWKYFFEDRPFRVSLFPAAIAAACAVGSKDQGSGLVMGAGLVILLFPSGKVRSIIGRLRHAVYFTFWMLLFYTIVAILRIRCAGGITSSTYSQATRPRKFRVRPPDSCRCSESPCTGW
jgi:dolichyl-phosphate-mannose--protein O-mannosyl transferase